MSWDPQGVCRVKCLYAPLVQGQLRPSPRFFPCKLPFPQQQCPAEQGNPLRLPGGMRDAALHLGFGEGGECNQIWVFLMNSSLASFGGAF